MEMQGQMKLCHCGNTTRIAYIKMNGEPYFDKLCRQCNYQKYKEKALACSKRNTDKRNSDPLRRIAFLIKEADKRNKDWTLSYDEAMMFWNKECHYCGDEVEGLHLDRINSEVGYQLDNVVSACGVCNIMKYTLSQDNFINKCKQIVSNSQKKQEV
jgi:hypothetical protein